MLPLFRIRPLLFRSAPFPAFFKSAFQRIKIFIAGDVNTTSQYKMNRSARSYSSILLEKISSVAIVMQRFFQIVLTNNYFAFLVHFVSRFGIKNGAALSVSGRGERKAFQIHKAPGLFRMFRTQKGAALFLLMPYSNNEILLIKHSTFRMGN